MILETGMSFEAALDLTPPQAYRILGAVKRRDARSTVRLFQAVNKATNITKDNQLNVQSWLRKQIADTE